MLIEKLVSILRDKEERLERVQNPWLHYRVGKGIVVAWVPE